MTLVTDRRHETVMLMMMMMMMMTMTRGDNKNHKHSSQSNTYYKRRDSVEIRATIIGCSGKKQ